VGNLLSITNSAASQFDFLRKSSSGGAPGSSLTLYGTGFCSDPAVTIGGVAATVVSATSTQIVVTVPSGASSGPIQITCGQSQLSAGAFSVSGGGAAAPPSISGFSPAMGVPGTSITISGTGFQQSTNGNVVTIGSSAAQVTSATPTSITAAVPQNASSGPITVSTLFGQAVSSADFILTPAGTNVGFGTQATVGTASTMTVSTANQQAELVFSGTVGQRVSFQISNSTFPPSACVWITVYDPSWIALTGGNYCGGSAFFDAVTLPKTGTYSLLLSPGGGSTGSASVTVYEFADAQAAPMTVGGPAQTITNTVPGQNVYAPFSGNAGQPISLNFSGSTIPCCYYGNTGIKIYNPDGTVLFSGAFSYSGGTLYGITLPVTGAYTVLINPSGNYTGSVNLEIFDTTPLAENITVGGPSLRVTLVPGQSANLSFPGTAGQIVSLQITNSSYPCCSNTVAFKNPDGSTLVTNQSLSYGSALIFGVTLPSTGTYTIQFVPSGGGSGGATFQLYDSYVTGTVSVGGSSISATSEAVGQDQKFTFTGSAGQVVSVSVTANFPCCNNAVTVTNPDGSTLASGTFNSTGLTLGTLTLPADGTYTILVVPAGAGIATLQIWNLTDLSGGVITGDTYAQTVLNDGPALYWRLDDATLATAANAAPTIAYGVTGPTFPDTAITLSGAYSYISTTTQFSNPQVFSIEVWFKTRTTNGGRLAGFENVQVGSTSNSYDRLLYMTNSGSLIFGTYNSGFHIVQSSAAYNDGDWHHAVASFSSGAATLYVDGNSVASGNLGAAQNFSGWWRWDGGSAWGGSGGTWPQAPNSLSFNGSLAQAALYSTALTPTQVANHFNAAAGGSYGATILSDSPIGYWKLNLAGGASVPDASGHNNNATIRVLTLNGLYQGNVTLDVAGVVGTDGAVTLDGTTGYVTEFVPINNPKPFSLEAWFKTTTTAGGDIAGFANQMTGTPTSWDRMIYMTNSGQIIFGTYDTTNRTVTSPGSYNDGAWHQVVATWANNTLSLYMDGSLVGTASGGVQNYVGYWRVGDDNGGNWPSHPTSNFFAGTVDEFAVYNYALSASQIASHYAAQGG
jgi:Concanavalin A-like lectin/glucanases superfamily/IPT/TIG domain